MKLVHAKSNDPKLQPVSFDLYLSRSSLIQKSNNPKHPSMAKALRNSQGRLALYYSRKHGIQDIPGSIKIAARIAMYNNGMGPRAKGEASICHLAAEELGVFLELLLQ
jgi:hypothetical protein